MLNKLNYRNPAFSGFFLHNYVKNLRKIPILRMNFRKIYRFYFDPEPAVISYEM